MFGVRVCIGLLCFVMIDFQNTVGLEWEGGWIKVNIRETYPL